jgi:hypothetical protein
VTLGEAIDWDPPSDSIAHSTTHILGTKTVYFRGTDTGVVPDCGTQVDANRYAASYMLGKYTKAEYADTCANNTSIFGVFVERNDTLTNHDTVTNSNLEGAYYWNRMVNSPGLTAKTGIQDYRAVYTYYANRNFGVNDTVTVYTALVTILNGNEASLDKSLNDAFDWYWGNLRKGCPRSCCLALSGDGRTGNIDGDPDKGVDISDLSALIDFLYISFTPPPCMLTANTDGDPDNGVDISDLSALIDFLYISFTPPALCH